MQQNTKSLKYITFDNNSFGEKMSLEEEVKKLREKIMELEKRIKFLENHSKHSSLINAAIDLIKEKKITTLSDIRRTYPSIFGRTQQRLYETLSQHPEFIILEGVGRGRHTLIAYIEDPKSPEGIAIDYFQKLTNREKKSGSIKEIMEIYNIDDETARKVFEILKTAFKEQLMFTLDGKEVMIKSYYRIYRKRLKGGRL